MSASMKCGIVFAGEEVFCKAERPILEIEEELGEFSWECHWLPIAVETNSLLWQGEQDVRLNLYDNDDVLVDSCILRNAKFDYGKINYQTAYLVFHREVNL